MPGPIQQVLLGQSAAAAGTAYRYFRWSMTKVGAIAGNLAGAASLAVTTASGDRPSSSMSSNTTPSPLVASAESEYSGSYQAWQCFDGNSATDWVSMTTSASGGAISTWVRIDLGAGNGVVPTGCKITSSSNGGRIPPTDFEFQGSNDGSAWTTLVNQSGLSWTTSETKTFSIP